MIPARKKTARQVRKILLRHKGAMSQIATELGVRRTAVSQTLAQRMVSGRILEATRVKAELLLEQESQQGSAA